MYLLVFWIFNSWAYLTLIPAIVFVVTILYLCINPLKQTGEEIDTNTEESFLKKTMFCNGNLDKIIIIDIVSGYLLGILFFLSSKIFGFNGDDIVLVLFVHYFLVQGYHYVNLITARRNTLKTKVFCIFFMIPELYMISIALIVLFPFSL